VTPKGGERNTKVGRYRSPEESGRITARTPENAKHSPPWWGKTALGLLTMCEGGGMANATIIERLG